MSKDRHSIIDALASDLQPVRPVARVKSRAGLWWALSWLSVVAVGLYFGPMRDGFMGQFLQSPAFAIESLLGLFAGIAFAVLAFSLAVPGRDLRWLEVAAFAALAAWFAANIFGLQHPALDPSMHGKREHCVLEAYMFSVLPILALLWWCRRAYVLRSLRCGLYAGLAAGALPALFMQMACMYGPEHNLINHLLPIGAVSLATGVLFWLALPKR